MTPKLKLIIADDHPISLHGLLRILEAVPDVEIVGQAKDGAEAWHLIQTKHPDVALLDLRMPILDGLAVARLIRQQEQPVPFIFLTMWKEEAIFNEAISLGCSGYLLKESAAEEILAAIRAAAAGRRYLSPAVSDFVLRWSQREKAMRAAHPGLALLTTAEHRVLKLIADNKTTKEIAEHLQTSPRTVDHQRGSISTKLGLQGSHSLLRFAFEHRWEL
jgi:DNA-binding NarL/FixJ family response regulator